MYVLCHVVPDRASTLQEISEGSVLYRSPDPQDWHIYIDP